MQHRSFPGRQNTNDRKGPPPITAASVSELLQRAINPFPLASDLFRKERFWALNEREAILTVIKDVLGTAKRVEYTAKGVVMDGKALAAAEDEVKNFITEARRAAEPQKGGNRRPPHANRGGANRGPNRFGGNRNQHANGQRDAGAKPVKQTELEAKASKLREQIAKNERDYASASAGTFSVAGKSLATLRNERAELIRELNAVRADIAEENRMIAEDKKKERVKRAEASAKASRSLTTGTHSTEISGAARRQAAKDAEAAKGKKGKRR